MSGKGTITEFSKLSHVDIDTIDSAEAEVNSTDVNTAYNLEDIVGTGKVRKYQGCACCTWGFHGMTPSKFYTPTMEAAKQFADSVVPSVSSAGTANRLFPLVRSAPLCLLMFKFLDVLESFRLRRVCRLWSFLWMFNQSFYISPQLAKKLADPNVLQRLIDSHHEILEFDAQELQPPRWKPGQIEQLFAEKADRLAGLERIVLSAATLSLLNNVLDCCRNLSVIEIHSANKLSLDGILQQIHTYATSKPHATAAATTKTVTTEETQQEQKSLVSLRCLRVTDVVANQWQDLCLPLLQSSFRDSLRCLSLSDAQLTISNSNSSNNTNTTSAASENSLFELEELRLNNVRYITKGSSSTTDTATEAQFFGDDFVDKFCDPSTLRVLSLSRTALSGTMGLGRFTMLEKLDVSRYAPQIWVQPKVLFNNNSSNVSADVLSQLTRIKSLNISWTPISSSTLNTIFEKMPHLEELDISGCSNITGEQFQETLMLAHKRNDNMRVLKALFAEIVTSFYSVISVFPNLEVLHVTSASLTLDDNNNNNSNNNNSIGIRNLALVGCSIVESSSLLALCKRTPRLQSLTLVGCKAITNSFLQDVAALPSRRVSLSLLVGACPLLTKDEAEKLRKAQHPNIAITFIADVGNAKQKKQQHQKQAKSKATTSEVQQLSTMHTDAVECSGQWLKALVDETNSYAQWVDVDQKGT